MLEPAHLNSSAIDLKPILIPLATVLVLVAVFGAAQGLTYPLLALLLEQRGYGPALIGLNAAMFPLGLIVSAPILPHLARRFGGPALAICCCVVMAAALAVLAATPNLAVWFIARFVLGMAVDGLFFLSETWINFLARPQHRGRLLALFATVAAGGFGLGPLVLLLTGLDGWPPFLCGIGAALLTMLLVLLTANRLPVIDSLEPPSLRRFLAIAPMLLVFVAYAAAFDQAVLSLLPVYVVDHGASVKAATLSVTVLAVGNVLLQLPVGWFADHFSRDGAIRLCLVATVLGGLAVPLVVTSSWALWPVLFVWGAAGYGLYTVALTVLGDKFSGSLLLAGNAAFSLMWGIGGLAGPGLIGPIMDEAGMDALPITLAVVAGLLAYAHACAGSMARPVPARSA